MRWGAPEAPAHPSLRALHRSGRWNALWATQPQRHLRLLPDGRAPGGPAGAPASLAPPPDATTPGIPATGSTASPMRNVQPR